MLGYSLCHQLHCKLIGAGGLGETATCDSSFQGEWEHMFSENIQRRKPLGLSTAWVTISSAEPKYFHTSLKCCRCTLNTVHPLLNIRHLRKRLCSQTGRKPSSGAWPAAGSAPEWARPGVTEGQRRHWTHRIRTQLWVKGLTTHLIPMGHLCICNPSFIPERVSLVQEITLFSISLSSSQRNHLFQAMKTTSSQSPNKILMSGLLLPRPTSFFTFENLSCKLLAGTTF